MAQGNKLTALAPGSAPTAAKSVSEDDRRYMAQEDLRTLKQAESVRCDPDRMKAAKAHADSEMKAYANLFGKPGTAKGSPRAKR